MLYWKNKQGEWGPAVIQVENSEAGLGSRKVESTSLRFILFGGRIDSAADGMYVGVERNREVFSLNMRVNLFISLCHVLKMGKMHGI